jgi:hypothetical protein
MVCCGVAADLVCKEADVVSDTTKSILCGLLVGLLSWCIVILCFCVMAGAEELPVEVGEDTSSGVDAGAVAADGGESPQEPPGIPIFTAPPTDADAVDDIPPPEPFDDSDPAELPEADAGEIFVEPVNLEYIEKLLEDANKTIAQVESRLATLTDAPAPPPRLFLTMPFAEYTVLEGFSLLFLIILVVAGVYHMFRRFV